MTEKSYYESTTERTRAIRSLGFFPLAVLSTALGLLAGESFPIICGAVGSLVVGPMFFLYILRRKERTLESNRVGQGVTVAVVLVGAAAAGAVVLALHSELDWAAGVTLLLYVAELNLAWRISPWFSPGPDRGAAK